MSFILRANNKDYTVSDHAARRMLERFISEEIVIETLENGALIEQEQGNDAYEHQIYDETLEDIIIVRVVVDEENGQIVTVIDFTRDS
jgi:uncharacterized protein DUF4258